MRGRKAITVKAKIIKHIPQRFLLPQIRISSGLVRERSFLSALDHNAFPWCPYGSDTVPWLVHSSFRTSRLRHTHMIHIRTNSRPVPSSQARWKANSVFIWKGCFQWSTLLYALEWFLHYLSCLHSFSWGESVQRTIKRLRWWALIVFANDF